MNERKTRRTCTRCNGTGKVDHWPAWEDKPRKIPCPGCNGRGYLAFSLPKKLDEKS